MLNRRTVLGVLAAGAFAGVAAGAFGALSTNGIAAERMAFDRTAFEAALAAGGPVLIDVSATWCSTCRRQREIVTELTKRPKFQDYKIFVIDYDSEKDIMRAFGAQQRSTLIAFKGATEVGRIVADTRPAVIEALLAKAI